MYNRDSYDKTLYKRVHFMLYLLPRFVEEVSLGFHPEAQWLMRMLSSFNVTIWVIQPGLPRETFSEFRHMMFRSAMVRTRYAFQSLPPPVMWLHKLFTAMFSTLTICFLVTLFRIMCPVIPLSYTTTPRYPAYKALQQHIQHTHIHIAPTYTPSHTYLHFSITSPVRSGMPTQPRMPI